MALNPSLGSLALSLEPAQNAQNLMRTVGDLDIAQLCVGIVTPVTNLRNLIRNLGLHF